MKYGLYQKCLFPFWGGGGAARKPRLSNMLGRHSLHYGLSDKRQMWMRRDGGSSLAVPTWDPSSTLGSPMKVDGETPQSCPLTSAQFETHTLTRVIIINKLFNGRGKLKFILKEKVQC